MSAPYGHCPICGGVGVSRERRPNGNDECADGHVYPSASAASSARASSLRSSLSTVRRLEVAANDALTEAIQAAEKWPPFNSAHEGFAVLKEEVDELWEQVRLNQSVRSSVGSDISDVYSEAKGVGYDVKTIRKIVALRKMDSADRDEQDALLDTYKHALGMV